MAEPNYDVAISFLARDEPTARELNTALEQAGLSVFFFPRKQEELAGTDGMEAMRTPFMKGRLIVILYRPPWGDTPWTRVEETAIKDRCLKDGWGSLVFVVLDRTKPIPKWLPDGRIRFNFEDYGMEQAIGAVKMRVQELGGVLQRASPVVMAKILKEKADLKHEQDVLFRDTAWAQGTAKPVIEALMKSLMAEVERIKGEAGLPLEVAGYEPHMAGFRAIIRYKRVTLEVFWKQWHLNVVEDIPLECTEYNARVYLLRERRGVVYREPPSLRSQKYFAALNLARQLRWTDKRKPEQLLSNDDVVGKIIDQLLDLVARLDGGKIPERSFLDD